ncbi:MAG: hypothetical protein WCF20_05185 [Methylovirgula sp.]
MGVDRRQRLGERSRKSDERCFAARAAVSGFVSRFVSGFVSGLAAGVCAARVRAKGVFDRFGGSGDPKGTERER